MEFEELQQIWDSQNKRPLYAIDEQALHNRILSKKRQASHITNTSELLLILMNLGAGSLVLGMNFFSPDRSVFMYLLSAWVYATALYLLVSRIRRINSDYRFNRSMRGDLLYAISVATYQVRLSQLTRWNTLPIGILTLLGTWEGGKPVWMAVAVLIFFALASYAGGWEHRNYEARKRELEILQNKLEGGQTS